ncbi:CHAD domain-containing protein [Andreprevotia chitinilytica]|uniref:CHAD domain-containing protein n=1 Tax=Andreprevotia chitinilytica TaxID=396808 RepID=UPI0005523E2B|nr:CHAD domain-containing protein [Andreprevotia chitinilytica]
MARKKQLARQIDSLFLRLDALRANLLAGSDPEALHEFRVALRGLRTLLPLLLTKRDLLDQSLRAGWRKLASLTGPARDAEVMLSALPADHPAIAMLKEQEAAAYREVIAALERIDWPVLHAASRARLNNLIDTRRGKRIRLRIRRKASRLAHTLNVELETDNTLQHWHLLRIEIKRLRYLIEHAGPWLPKSRRRAYPALKHAQGVLGELHDLEVRTEAGIVLPGDASLREKLLLHAAEAVINLRQTRR